MAEHLCNIELYFDDLLGFIFLHIYGKIIAYMFVYKQRVKYNK